MPATEPQGATDAPATFARLVAGMSRFLTQLSQAAPFSNANIALGEWCMLAMIANTDGVAANALARILGVTNKRVAQISQALNKANLVSISKPANSKREIVAITEAGAAALRQLNVALEPLVAGADGARRKSLADAEKVLLRLNRITSIPRTTAK